LLLAGGIYAATDRPQAVSSASRVRLDDKPDENQRVPLGSPWPIFVPVITGDRRQAVSLMDFNGLSWAL
jgi:hypothetical protein